MKGLIKSVYRQFFAKDLAYWQRVSDREISANAPGVPVETRSDWLEDNFVIYFSSRNNYDLFAGEFLRKIDTAGFKIINVDDGSIDSEFAKSTKLEQTHNVTTIENEGKGIQWATQSVANYLSKVGSKAKWLVHFTHDNFPIVPGFFDKIDTLIESGQIERFGTLGFNHIELRKTIPAYQDHLAGKGACGLLGLARLANLPGKSMYYGSNPNVDWDWNVWGKPFLIESVLTPAFAINLDLFRKKIQPTDDFRLFLWSDDVAMQFLNQGIEHVVVPSLMTVNRQDVKDRYGIPVVSARAKNDDYDKFFAGSTVDHRENWKKRWGWDIFERSSMDDHLSRYAGSLVEEYYRHDLRSGPVGYVDIEVR